jgi:hypothetical protein
MEARTKKKVNVPRLIALVAGLVTAAVLLCGALDPYPSYMTIYENHVVEAGQTVWEIAARNFDKQDRARTMDEFVGDIIRYNGIRNADIYPGQVIVIPLDVKKGR